MKKFKTEFKYDNHKQYKGEDPHNDISDDYVGDCIEAESKEEALDFAIDWLQQEVLNNNINVDMINRDKDSILFLNNDTEEYFQYYNGVAVEVD